MGRAVVHWELMSKDPAKGSAFYEKIFGWKIQHVPESKQRTGHEPGSPEFCLYTRMRSLP